MNKKELLEALARLVKKQVEREVKKQTEIIKMNIISEVAGMLNYSENKLMTMINESRSVGTAQQPQQPRYAQPGGDYEKVMGNLKTMSGFEDRVSKMGGGGGSLKDILSETTGFGQEEVSQMRNIDGSPMGGGLDYMQMGGTQEPWSNEPRGQYQQPQQRSQPKRPSGVVTGLDGKPVDLDNPTVQKVLSVLQNTDHKQKFERINEVADSMFGHGAIPNMGGQSMVTSNDLKNNYFEKTTLD